MIKFFRKIRHNLIETGKTGKYFKYAIGEIILVMIGILLALQVNNWNINKINSVKEIEYLTGLKNDLEKQITEIGTAKPSIHIIRISEQVPPCYRSFPYTIISIRNGWLYLYHQVCRINMIKMAFGVVNLGEALFLRP